MQDNPLLIVLLFAGAMYLAHMWFQDFRAWQSGRPVPKALPGATSAARWLVVLGVVGALVLVAVETAGEYALGVSADQKDITALFLLAMIAAGFLEEVIFRGYLYYDGKGPLLLWASIVGFSLVFALLHYQYYLEWQDDASWYQFELVLSPHSAWTLGILFVNSIWFYSLRFAFRNRHRSLIPCVAAHVASNLGVFLVKLAQGHVVGWY